MKIKEIMTKIVISLSPDTTAKDALEQLQKASISGLPVLDSEGRLVGMFTEKNIIAHILPSYVEKVGRFIYEENPKVTRKKFAELSTIKVSQLMRTEVVTATEDTSLCEAAKTMIVKSARRLPVLDKDKKVVGVVARCDIIRAFQKEAASAV